MNGAETAFPHLVARLDVRPTGHGGRAHAIFAGYRAGWRVPQQDGSVEYTDGAVFPVEGGEIMPGSAGTIHIVPLREGAWLDALPGIRIEMVEGPRVVGVAVVYEALPVAKPLESQEKSLASSSDD